MRYLAAKTLLLTLILLGTQVQAAFSPSTSIHRGLQTQAHQQEGGKLLVQLKAHYQERKYALAHQQASQQLGEKQVLFFKGKYEERKAVLTQQQAQELVPLFIKFQARQQALAQEQAQQLAQAQPQAQAQLQTQHQAAKQALIQAQTQELLGVKAKHQVQMQEVDQKLQMGLSILNQFIQPLQRQLEAYRARIIQMHQEIARMLSISEAQTQEQLKTLERMAAPFPPTPENLALRKAVEQRLVNYKASLEAYKQQLEVYYVQMQAEYEKMLEERVQQMSDFFRGPYVPA